MIFWPENVSSCPGIINRFGRILHWTLTAFATVFLTAGSLAYLEPSWRPGSMESIFLLLGLGSVAFAIGRACRYVFSGE